MQRINTTNKAVDLFGSGKHGFQAGVPTSGIKATYLSEQWCNATQEELAALVEWAGLTPDSAANVAAQDNKQNLKALALVLQKQLMTSVTTAGTAPAYTAAFSYSPASNPITVTLTAGLRVCVTFHASNNGAACTLNVNGLGAKPLKQYDSSGSLVNPFITASRIADVVYDGSSFVILNEQAGGELINVRVFSTVGSSVYVPTSGTKSVLVKVQGGGGSGGGCNATGGGQIAVGSGGSAGSYAESYYTSNFANVNVTVGAGGASSVGLASNAGGTSSFGSFLTCPGGLGGSSAGPTPPPWITGISPSPYPSGANIYATSGSPGAASMAIQVNAVLGAPGGSSTMGAGGGSASSGSSGQAASGFGGGGGGTASSQNQAAVAGGRGGNGLVVVYEYGVKA